jgi:phosphoglycerate dehydrogenase-like enzyme
LTIKKQLSETIRKATRKSLTKAIGKSAQEQACADGPSLWRCDGVAVIGTGVIGASVGWHLMRRGVDVLFVDSGPPGAGVSAWTFSWVNASDKTRSTEYFDLNLAGMDAHRHLAEHLSGPA